MKEIYSLFWNYITLFVMLAMSVSCNRIDEELPVISVKLPQEGSTFFPFDTLKVEAALSDNEKITSASVQLLDQDLQPVSQIKNYRVNKSTFNLLHDIVFEDDLESAEYFVKIRAFDEAENSKSEFIEVNFSNENVQQQQVLLVAKSSPSQYSLYNWPQESGSYKLISQFSGDYFKSDYGQETEQFYGFGQSFGDLISYSVVEDQLSWTKPFISNDPFLYFLDLHFADGLAYVAYREGWVRGFNQSGLERYTAPSRTGFYPKRVFKNGAYVYTVEEEIAGGDDYFNVYFAASGAVFTEKFFGIEFLAFAKASNENVYLVGKTTTGDYNLYFYHKISGVLDRLAEIGNSLSVVNMHQDEQNNLYVLTNTTIYNYSVSAQTISASALPIQGVFSSDFDAEQRELVITNGTDVVVFTPNNLNVSAQLDDFPQEITEVHFARF